MQADFIGTMEGSSSEPFNMKKSTLGINCDVKSENKESEIRNNQEIHNNQQEAKTLRWIYCSICWDEAINQ